MNKLVIEMDSDLFTELSVYCASLGETKKTIVARAIEKLLKERNREKNE